MTEDEKKKLRAGFVKKKPEEEADQWTEEELIKAAKRIIKRLGLEGKLQ